MDKVKEMEATFNHGISLAERKNVVVTGVKKIESFDNEEFLVDTTVGFRTIWGEGLEIIKLDTYQGNVTIKGQVDSLAYVSKDLKKEKDESFLSKLFKKPEDINLKINNTLYWCYLFLIKGIYNVRQINFSHKRRYKNNL